MKLCVLFVLIGLLGFGQTDVPALSEKKILESPAGTFNMNKGRDGENNHENDKKEVESNSEIDGCDNVATKVALVPNLQQTGDLFKSCIEELFDFFPLEDILSFGETCKRLYQITGHILRQSYSGVRASYSKDDHIYIGNSNRAEHFVEFVNHLIIGSMRHIQYFLNIQSKFDRIKQLELASFEINTTIIGRMTQVLQKVKYLRINWCEIDGVDFNEMVLSHCPNVTHLSLSSHPNGSTIIGSGNEWLLQKYPRLEHFELTSFREQIPELKTFLELNPNIQTFLCSEQTLWENRESMLSSNIQLNELAIKVALYQIKHFTDFCGLLTKLHERGFYKRLNLYFHWQHGEEPLDQLAALPSLVKLTIYCFVNVGLSAFTNLEELYFKDSEQLTDLEAMATNLVHLKKIHFGTAYVNHISLLIRRAENLSKIIVDYLFDETLGPKIVYEGFFAVRVHNKSVVIKLAALNREREQMRDARKITLYVEEEVYLATKWEMGETDLSLIQLKRRESYQQDNNFDIY